MVTFHAIDQVLKASVKHYLTFNMKYLVFERGYESSGNRRAYGKSSPVIEASDYLPNPTHNGKLWILNKDDDDNDDDDDDDDDG